VIVGTYSSIYIASPLLLIFGEGAPTAAERARMAQQAAAAARE
jgi:preprotein translocase subunit SecF